MSDEPENQENSHRKLVIILVSVVALMFGVAFASVPLYNLFCRVTGFGGTTQVAEDQSSQVIDRWITVRFNADIDKDLPWKFKPDQKEVMVRVGENSLVSFSAENLTNESIKGMAVYNVTPDKVGPYFYKIACFCFDEQTLEPRQKVHMPVSFYIDPDIITDDNLDEVKTITLSYTFFRAVDDE